MKGSAAAVWKCWPHTNAQTHTDMGRRTKETPSRHKCTYKQLQSVAECMYCRAPTPRRLHDSWSVSFHLDYDQGVTQFFFLAESGHCLVLCRKKKSTISVHAKVDISRIFDKITHFWLIDKVNRTYIPTSFHLSFHLSFLPSFLSAHYQNKMCTVPLLFKAHKSISWPQMDSYVFFKEDCLTSL